MDILEKILPELTDAELSFHLLIFLGNITLFIFARPILNLINPSSVSSTRVRLFRTINLFVFILQIFGLILMRTTGNYESYFIKIGYSIMAVYGAFLLQNFLSAQSRRRFGRQRNLDGKDVYFQTYSSRMIDLVLMVILILSTIYLLILIWQVQDLFTGIYAILAAFLAFTSGIWAPDIISGLIVLNSETLEDGDVILINGHDNEYLIGRVTLIYVVLYDIRNNNRTLMRNSQFTSRRIDNLSKVTSSDGLRQSLLYKIGYPAFSGDSQNRQKQLAEFKKSIDDMFSKANQTCNDDERIFVNTGDPFEWAMTNAGDFALEYTLWVYLDKIPNTKITSRARKHLMGTMYKINEAVFEASIIEGIDLSTPNVHQVSLSGAEQAGDQQSS